MIPAGRVKFDNVLRIRGIAKGNRVRWNLSLVTWEQRIIAPLWPIGNHVDLAGRANRGRNKGESGVTVGGGIVIVASDIGVLYLDIAELNRRDVIKIIAHEFYGVTAADRPARRRYADDQIPAVAVGVMHRV